MPRITTSSARPPLRGAAAAWDGAVAACTTLLLAFWPLAAPAQVMRCTDVATGQVTYTNGECDRGTSVREIEARKTPEQIQEERTRAAQALAAQREREHQEAQEQRGRRTAEPMTPTQSVQAAADPAQSAQCQQARRALQEVNASLGRGMYDEQARLDQAQREADLACLTPAAYAEAERARARRATAYSAPPYYLYTPPAVAVPRPQPKPQPRPAFTGCNVFRCYDAQGNTYPR